MRLKYFISQKMNIAASSSIFFLGRVSDTPHVVFYVKSVETMSQPLEINFYEDPVVTSEGTPITPNAMNRNVTIPPETLAFASPVVSDNGLLLKQYPVIAEKHVGGHAGNGEIPLKRNSDYLYEIKNLGTSPTDVYINFIWEEVQ